MNKLKSLLFFFVSVSVLGVFVYLLYPKVHPFYSLKNVVAEDSIDALAGLIIRDFEIDKANDLAGIELRSQNKLLRRIQYEYGLEQANVKTLEGFPSFQWRYRIDREDDDVMTDGQEELINKLFGDIRLDFDQYGFLSELRIIVEDEVELPVLNEYQAKETAVEFIKKYTRYNDLEIDTTSGITNDKEQSLSIGISPTEGADIEQSTVIKRSNRTDYKFSFTTYDDITNDEVIINVTLAGNVITSLEANHQIDSKVPEQKIYAVIVVISTSVILFVLIIIFAYKKFRAYEIGFKSALFIGSLSALGLLIEIIYETGPNFHFEMLIGWILGPLFLGLALVVVWAVNEAVGREVWKEKYIEFDLLTNGHLLHSRLGHNLLYGLGVGMLMMTGWLLLTYFADLFASVSVVREGNNDTLFTGGNDAFYLLGKYAYRSIYVAGVFVGIAASLLRKVVSSKWLLIFAVAFIYSLGLQGSIRPFEIDFIVEFILALILIYSFVQFNLFMAVIAIFTYSMLTSGIAYFYIESADFSSSLWYFLFLAALPVIFGIISIFTKDRLEDIDSITPAFVKNVTERQRLQGEIEAAKAIQASFLPNETPEITGLDIAAKCLPALEVGGDYYDFIKHDDKNLSVLIGDVAGKGTKAAFVMSLTKGFFKALAKKLSPPGKVLSEINELFYEEVGRGSFISIIYGQFDLENSKFTYGRAGHNPVLYLKKGSKTAEYFQPQGIAIGMEKGILFSKTIEEQEINFTSGDVFVLYTDGFPEAMNTKDIQFGEDQFARIVEECKDKSANEIMEALFNNTLKFIGRAKQYDDMTMVVVKIP